MPIELPVVLLIVFKMLLGLGGEPGWWGGGRGNFMHSYHNFPLVNQKKNVRGIRSYQFFDTRLLGTKGYVNVLTDD